MLLLGFFLREAFQSQINADVIQKELVGTDML